MKDVFPYFSVTKCMWIYWSEGDVRIYFLNLIKAYVCWPKIVCSQHKTRNITFFFKVTEDCHMHKQNINNTL